MTKKLNRNDYKEMIEGLHLAWEQLRKHPHKETAGHDKENINSFSSHYSDKIDDLRKEILENTFTLTPLKRATVDKGREILIPTIKERIVTISILNAIFPRLEKFNSNLDFSRKSKYLDPEEEPDFDGTPLAVEKIQEAINDGYVWILEADIQKFFDYVPKDKVFNILQKRVKNKKVLSFIKQIIYFNVLPSTDKDPKEYNNTQGIAQGSSLSPILASIYLYEFDMYIGRMKDVRLVRYVDDFIILCKDKATADRVYSQAHKKLKSMGLHMYELGEKSSSGAEKTKITLAKGYGAMSFDFLGLTFNNTDVDISKKKKEAIDEKLKDIIHSEKDNLLKKIRSVDSRINGYIDHYRKPHYSRTAASLVSIINAAEQDLKRYYVTKYKKITGKDPFHKFSISTVDQLFGFMGIDFAHLVVKAKTPIKIKKKRVKTSKRTGRTIRNDKTKEIK